MLIDQSLQSGSIPDECISIPVKWQGILCTRAARRPRKKRTLASCARRLAESAGCEPASIQFISCADLVNSEYYNRLVWKIELT